MYSPASARGWNQATRNAELEGVCGFPRSSPGCPWHLAAPGVPGTWRLHLAAARLACPLHGALRDEGRVLSPP